ncbi:MAG: hypothetical protein D6723_03690 [Acidobacteria bacterium]|nr:MAG: hypothetical protein D6723_03690 [Acidobacteriota bacterium]
MKTKVLIMSLLMGTMALILAGSVRAQPFEFHVEHDHRLGHCRGTLVIGPETIQYRTPHRKHERIWRYTDIKRIEIRSPRIIHIVTYESRGKLWSANRRFEFKLRDEDITAAVSDFLLRRVTRPLVLSVLPTIERQPTFVIPAKHRHRRGGCEGVLKVYPDALVFASQNPKHTRYWRYQDIQQIGRLGPYQFEVATYEHQVGGPDRVFHFELKERLDDPIYDYLWVRVNRTKYYPYEPEQPVRATPTSGVVRLSTRRRVSRR